MDAFFIKIHDFKHPYPVKVWSISTYASTPYMITYDDVKIRLFDYLKKEKLYERDFSLHEPLTYPMIIRSKLNQNKVLFAFVRNRRNLIVFNDQLMQMNNLDFDTNIIILASLWSQERETLFISGNFGWVRALKLSATSKMSCPAATWVPGWSSHESNLWVTDLTLDEFNGRLIGASKTDIVVYNVDDGSLLLKFNTDHSQEISCIRYSEERMILYTGSSDGSIKSWKIFEKNHQNIQTIRQVNFSFLTFELDEKSIITLSHERVLRRYDTVTNNLIAELKIEQDTQNQKSIERPVKLATVCADDKQWVFESDSHMVTLFEALYAPKELHVCCGVVQDILATKGGRIFAFCKNNVVHEIRPANDDGRKFDLDTMKLANKGVSHPINRSFTRVVYDNDSFIIGFESGEVKLLNLLSGELFEYTGTGPCHPIKILRESSNILWFSHKNCKEDNLSYKESYIVINDPNDSLIQLCSRCKSFIGSWNFSSHEVLDIIFMENGKYILTLEKFRVTLLSFTSVISELSSEYFGELNFASFFCFVNETDLAVVMSNGKCSVFKPDFEREKIELIHTYSLTDSHIIKVIPCFDLRKQDGGENIINQYNLQDLLVALCDDSTLVISNAKNGLIQHKVNIPSYVNNASFCLLSYCKLYVVLSLDENVRTMEWPQFTPIIPTATTEEEEKNEKDETQKALVSHEEVDPNSSQESSLETQVSKSKSMDTMPPTDNTNKYDLINLPDEIESQLLTKTDQAIINKTVAARFVQNGEEKSRIKFVYEDGIPKIVVSKDETLSNESSQISDESIPLYDVIDTPINEEHEIPDKTKLFLGDVLQQSHEKKSVSEIDKHNRELFEKILEENPNVKHAFYNKAVRKISERIDNFEDDFYDLFLTIDVKHYVTQSERERKQRRRTLRDEDSNINTDYVKYLAMRPPVESIKPIGNRKSQKKKKKMYMVVEFEDGTKMKTDSATVAALCNLSSTKSSSDPVSMMTPGYIFQRAIRELDMKKKQTIKKLIISEQKLIGLPIQILTSSGIRYGAEHRRFFGKDPPKNYREEVCYSKSPRPKSRNCVNQMPFYHWEDVYFDSFPQKPDKKKNNANILSPSHNRSSREYDDSYVGDKLVFDTLKTPSTGKSSRNLSKAGEEYSNESFFKMGDGGFDKLTSSSADHPDFLEKLGKISPSVQQITDILGDDDNPIMSLLNSTPNKTTEEILFELNSGYSLNGPVLWKPTNLEGVQNPNNMFNIFGLEAVKGLKSDVNRPPSPRPHDALASLVNLGQRSSIMSTIPEFPTKDNDLGETSISEEYEEDYFQSLTEDEIIIRKQKKKNTRKANEALKRNDFASLRAVLEKNGLVKEDQLIDFPKWQPSVKFISNHMKMHSEFDNEAQDIFIENPTARSYISSIPSNYSDHKPSNLEDVYYSDNCSQTDESSDESINIKSTEIVNEIVDEQGNNVVVRRKIPERLTKNFKVNKLGELVPNVSGDSDLMRKDDSVMNSKSISTTGKESIKQYSDKNAFKTSSGHRTKRRSSKIISSISAGRDGEKPRKDSDHSRRTKRKKRTHDVTNIKTVGKTRASNISPGNKRRSTIPTKRRYKSNKLLEGSPSKTMKNPFKSYTKFQRPSDELSSLVNVTNKRRFYSDDDSSLETEYEYSPEYEEFVIEDTTDSPCHKHKSHKESYNSNSRDENTRSEKKGRINRVEHGSSLKKSKNMSNKSVNRVNGNNVKGDNRANKFNSNRNINASGSKKRNKKKSIRKGSRLPKGDINTEQSEASEMYSTYSEYETSGSSIDSLSEGNLDEEFMNNEDALDAFNTNEEDQSGEFLNKRHGVDSHQTADGESSKELDEERRLLEQLMNFGTEKEVDADILLINSERLLEVKTQIKRPTHLGQKVELTSLNNLFRESEKAIKVAYLKSLGQISSNVDESLLDTLCEKLSDGKIHGNISINEDKSISGEEESSNHNLMDDSSGRQLSIEKDNINQNSENKSLHKEGNESNGNNKIDSMSSELMYLQGEHVHDEIDTEKDFLIKRRSFHFINELKSTLIPCDNFIASKRCSLQKDNSYKYRSNNRLGYGMNINVTSKTKLIRSHSIDYLLMKKKHFSRKEINMFGTVELAESKQIFLSYFAPSLWDTSRGVNRRNST